MVFSTKQFQKIRVIGANVRFLGHSDWADWEKREMRKSRIIGSVHINLDFSRMLGIERGQIQASPPNWETFSEDNQPIVALPMDYYFL